MRNSKHRPPDTGFTLVELMIVVAIIAVLASLAIPAFKRVIENSVNSRFVNDARVFAQGLESFYFEQKVPPTSPLFDPSSGVLPTGAEEYIDSADWNAGTPIGGVWDVDNQFGFVGVGADGYIISLEQLTRLDRTNDDGDLSAGNLQRVSGDRYYQLLSFED